MAKKPEVVLPHTGAKRGPKKPHSGSFKPGVSGNPAGKPKGSRHALCETFIESLQRVWRERGDEILEKAIMKDPATIINTISRLVPRDLHLDVTGGVTIDLSLDQRKRIAENWILSRQDDARMAALEGEAVRVESKAALPAPGAQDEIVIDLPPDRAPEVFPVKRKTGRANVVKRVIGEQVEADWEGKEV